MKILSLFDGISCARVALERAGIPVEAYYASEVDKYAMQISAKNYPDIVQLGSVTKVGVYSRTDGCLITTPDDQEYHNIDLLIGGSPCQDLSIAKKDRKGLDGDRSGLFWEYVRILKEVKPKYFILENVNSMPKEAKAIITEALGVEPIMINAALVSAQNRKRLFWTNIPNVIQPEDRGILLRDILEQDVDEKYSVNVSEKYGLKGLCEDKAKSLIASSYKGYGNDGVLIIRVGQIGKGGQGDRIYSPEGKSVGLSALGGGRGAKTGLYAVAPNGKRIVIEKEGLLVLGERRTELGKQSRKEIRESTGRDSTLRSKDHKEYFAIDGIKANCITTGLGMEGTIVEDYQIRKLTPTECERLQSLPDNYTEGVSNSQRYKMLGNAFNVDVVAHILSSLDKPLSEKESK